MPSQDEIEINAIVKQYFDLFTNTDNREPHIEDIKTIFIKDGMIINNTHDEPAIYNLDSFIAPRFEMLTDGTLINFKEWEQSSDTIIIGNIAQRRSSYTKSGILNGEPLNGEGTKLMQFIKVKDKWWLSSVVWSDK